eukprot:TRINITY_DN70324_c0_g1_i1.p1 TRINITY_DN70324_c0_g1~~TRINITY_DN70324_c0_g1_i1.p1  ORF type:complete len:181 (-),score=31.50 TRINITY_DN70324_c0_g1_i1:227-769(-)
MGNACGCEESCQKKEISLSTAPLIDPTAMNPEERSIPLPQHIRACEPKHVCENGEHVQIDQYEPQEITGDAFEFVIRKNGPQDDLGMFVKHMRGHLEVMNIIPNGAVDRANNVASMPLREGDIIFSVNAVSQNDAKMVAECKAAEELRLEVVRRCSDVAAESPFTIDKTPPPPTKAANAT